MSSEVVALPRRHPRDFPRELARELRNAAEWMERLGARGLASRYRRRAARLDHATAACETPTAGRGA